ncbi:MAG: hypothetical protein NTY19_35720 [Planctomycetota bacterium]|nr:hypothetical protein [Planctomycetota bacterium]
MITRPAMLGCETVVRLLRQAAITTGLRTTVNIIRRSYEIGQQVADDFKATMPLLFDVDLALDNGPFDARLTRCAGGRRAELYVPRAGPASAAGNRTLR